LPQNRQHQFPVMAMLVMFIVPSPFYNTAQP
jgi:hypothetical protein